MKFFRARARRRAESDARIACYLARVARWDAAMAAWESTQRPMIIKFHHDLTEEDILRIRKRFTELRRYDRESGHFQ